MKLIILTADCLIPNEAIILNRLFKEGMPRLHIRKPEATERELRELIEKIDPSYYNRIVLNDCFYLLDFYPLRGVHLNRRNPVRPDREVQSVSRSCHSLQEVELALSTHNYLFLSPIFDSVSKVGYTHAFTQEELLTAKTQGVINQQVMALGGITEHTLPLAATYGFGGAVVLGALWSGYLQNRNEKDLMNRFHHLWSIAKKE